MDYALQLNDAIDVEECLQDQLAVLNHGPLHVRMRDRMNPFEVFTDTQFLKHFHFTKDTTRQLTGLVAHMLVRLSHHNNPMPPELQVAATL